MLTYIAAYVCAWTALTSITALACGSLIAIAGVLIPRLSESELDSMRTPDAAELERLFGPCVPPRAEGVGNSLTRRRQLELTSHERSCVIAIGLFVLTVFVLSFMGMLLAATAA
jgi:hypothetical protein